MSLHSNFCPMNKTVFGACDLDGPREHMCPHCISELLRRERPADWSPRIKKSLAVDPNSDMEKPK